MCVGLGRRGWRGAGVWGVGGGGGEGRRRRESDELETNSRTVKTPAR